MVKLPRVAIAASMLIASVAAQTTAGPYGQCGGIGYSGPSACGAGYTCTSYNPYYFQCYPGAAPATSTTSSSSRTPTPTKPLTTTTSTTSRGTLTTTTSRVTLTTTTKPSNTGTGTGTGTGSVPTTLLSGWYWVRAVESPNFHSYLQAKPTNAPGPAYMDSYLSAGQFNIVGGQLVQTRGDGVAPLYMNVEDPVDKTQRKLQTWFDTAQNSYGTFAFQGDTVTWSAPDIDRPNTAAWLVCEDQRLYVNTGAYAYNTPAGCADETIHSYGGSTANL